LAEPAPQLLSHLAEHELAEDLVLALGEGGAAELALPVDLDGRSGEGRRPSASTSSNSRMTAAMVATTS